MMDFPVYYAMLGALNNGENWDAGWVSLYEALANDVIYPNPSKLVLFEGNHDTARLFSLLDNDFTKFTKAIVLMTTLPRIPQFFYGTEVLMQSPKQRDDGLVRSDFPGGWPGDKRNAFTKQGLAPEQINAQVLIKNLLNYRQHSPAIVAGKMTHFYPQDSIYSYVRTQQNTQAKQLWVFLSKNLQSVSVDLARYAELKPEHCEFFDVLHGQNLGALTHVNVPANGAVLLECQLP
jgi:neopullulanase